MINSCQFFCFYQVINESTNHFSSQLNKANHYVTEAQTHHVY